MPKQIYKRFSAVSNFCLAFPKKKCWHNASLPPKKNLQVPFLKSNNQSTKTFILNLYRLTGCRTRTTKAVFSFNSLSENNSWSCFAWLSCDAIAILAKKMNNSSQFSLMRRDSWYSTSHLVLHKGTSLRGSLPFFCTKKSLYLLCLSAECEKKRYASLQTFSTYSNTKSPRLRLLVIIEIYC